jgi:hypothetical protein
MLHVGISPIEAHQTQEKASKNRLFQCLCRVCVRKELQKPEMLGNLGSCRRLSITWPETVSARA